MSLDTKLTPAHIVTFSGPESMKKLAISGALFAQQLRMLATSYCKDPSVADDEQDIILPAVEPPSITILHGSKGPTTTTTPFTPEAYMRWDTLHALTQAPHFPPLPPAPEGAVKRSHTEEAPPPPLPATQYADRLLTLDRLMQHLKEDTSGDTLHALLIRLGALTTDGEQNAANAQIISTWFSSNLRLPFRVVDTRQWTENTSLPPHQE